MAGSFPTITGLDVAGRLWSWNSYLGIWGLLGAGGLMDEWRPRMMTSSRKGEIHCTGVEGNVGKWNGSGWVDEGKWGGWALKQVVWAPDGALWGVGREGNVGKWDEHEWDNLGDLGGWKLAMLAFAPDGTMYGVHKDCFAGKWADGAWDSSGLVRDVQMLAFDKAGQMWCVDLNGNVRRLNGDSEINLGNVGRIPMIWVCLS